MIEPKKKTAWFVALQGSYAGLSLALFKNGTCLDLISYEDKKASSHLIPYLDLLLSAHQLTLQDLSFIAVDQGPGAFTSLRVMIATVNGIAFARKIPLVGVNSLSALSHEVQQAIEIPGGVHGVGRPAPAVLVVLLNAYNNDCYYLCHDLPHGNFDDEIRGCEKIDLILARIRAKYAHQTILFAGNAVMLHEALLREAFGPEAQFEHSRILVAGAKTIGILAWNNRATVDSIHPCYMKTQLFALKKS